VGWGGGEVHFVSHPLNRNRRGECTVLEQKYEKGGGRGSTPLEQK